MAHLAIHSTKKGIFRYDANSVLTYIYPIYICMQANFRFCGELFVVTLVTFDVFNCTLNSAIYKGILSKNNYFETVTA